MQSFEYCSVPYLSKEINGTLTGVLVQRDQWDTYWGAKKIIFLIRDIAGPAMTAAPMEFCQFAARRSPGVRFGSAVVALWVGSGRVQAPTPHTPPLTAYFGQISQQTKEL